MGQNEHINFNTKIYGIPRKNHHFMMTQDLPPLLKNGVLNACYSHSLAYVLNINLSLSLIRRKRDLLPLI